MLQEIPYSKMKENKRAYEIMLLRDQKGCSFAEIAQEYQISAMRAREIYRKHKSKQIRLYIRYIRKTQESESNAKNVKTYIEVLNCYQDISYISAYFEKKYKDILTEYRKGEPGMPEALIKALPPFKQKLSKKEVARVIEMREKENASFKQIGKVLRITQAKAKDTYNWYYHAQALQMMQALKEQAESEEEKAKIHRYYFDNHYSSKRRYDMLLAHGAPK